MATRSPRKVWALVAGVAVALSAPGFGMCAGDCDGDGRVAVSELVRAVRIALGELPLSECEAADAAGDGAVAVADLILAVGNALEGCPAGACVAGGDPGCGVGKVCELPPGLCESTEPVGECVEQPRACPEVFQPVCGCDGRTYSNDCFRLAAGVQLLHEGACGEKQCGGFIGQECDEGEVCELPAGMCEVADLTGRCVERPRVCPLVLQPVCGCDGRTYGNDCERLRAGVALDHEGAC